MAKSKKAAAAAAITITEDCERDSSGFGALAFVQCDRKHMGIDRAGISSLKTELLAAGFESLEISLSDWLENTEEALQAIVAKCWHIDGDVTGWMPHHDEGLGEERWALVAVLFVGDPEGDNNDDAVAILARPANESAPWPFPKGKEGASGPEASSDASITEGGRHEQAASDAVEKPEVEQQPEPAPAMSKSEAHLQRKSAQFEILEPTDALLKTFTPRVEKHGDNDVSAASLGLQIEAPNTILDQLSPSLRATLYAAPEGQVTLPGIVESMPLLRTKVIENLKLTNCYEGWTLVITGGVDERDNIRITKCKVDKFVVTPRDGGSVTLDLRVGSSDISEEEAGWLYGHLRHEIEITLHAPEQKPAAIDGTQAAFNKDHPPQPDAGDLFAAQHGHQSPDDDHARDEGGGTYDEGDADSAPGEFPPEGDDPDADAAPDGEPTPSGQAEEEGADA